MGIAIGLVLILAACGSGDDGASDKFKQTWPKSYGSTTCAQWATDMSENQRFVAAADMLSNAQQQDTKGAGLPSDGLITQFEGDISEACQPIQSATIVDVATALYLTARDQYGP